MTFTGVPVPGATITATQGDIRLVTTSDLQGVYRLAEMADGAWTIRVEMLGFVTINREVTLPSDGRPLAWELTVVPFAEITRALPPPASSQGAPDPAPAGEAGRPERPGAPAPTPSGTVARSGQPDRQTSPNGQPGFQRANVNPAAARTAAGVDTPFSDDSPADSGMGATDGLLINGSVNNSATSPFAQPRAFGTGRPGQRSLYTGGVSALTSNSALDARPFSFTSQPTPKPSYYDMQFIGTFGGPLKIPRLLRRGPNLFLGYQRTTDHSATTRSEIMPTMLERSGDFSESRDPFGRPIQIVDPVSGQPFAGERIPSARVSPEAAALLGYYPQPNVESTGGYNFQTPVVVATHQDSAQARLTQVISGRDQLAGTASYQRTITDAANVFSFIDSTRTSALDTSVNWSHRLRPLMFLRARYQFTRLSTDVTPEFANRVNVSGLAGIFGNNQEPVNWGPPSLIFSSGIAGLATAQYASNTNLTNGWSGDIFWNRGRHSLTVGGGIRLQRFDVLSQQNPRGTFGFAGAATGSDFADFLLGIPQTSSIAFGNADKNLRNSNYEAFLNDDWRVSATLTVNVGIRWEYESPITEVQDRLVNLDAAPGFTAVSPVLATSPVGALTGQAYSDSLVYPDKRGFLPRLGVAWRPVPGSSLVIRAGYGIYRNTAAYQSMALLMAQQPPLSKTSSVANSPSRPLTLANGFVTSASSALNTFGVDPHFRVSDTQTWQVSAQRDLPASLTIIGTYLGSKGRHLMQEFLPNTYPAGASHPCPACPAGFVYLTSSGRSLRNSGQLQVRRRLRNGITATVQYTLAKATDDAAAFSGAGLAGAVIAQNWLDLDAEHGPSSFDQRHLISAQFQYTTGAGVTGGTLVDGLKGRLFKDWTFVSQLTVGSGLPLTPVYLSPVSGTGVAGSIRPRLTGLNVEERREGYYLNPAAYAAPASGQWGDTQRNSITGPAQFGLNAAVGRTFRFGDRLNLDWRIDATNVLNRVTYSGVNMIVGSPQFGLPNLANQMRRLQSSLRLRF